MNILSLLDPPVVEWEKLPLRDYQEDIVRQVLTNFSEGKKRNLVQLSTGGGKSLILSAIVADNEKKGKRSLLIAHKTELITQLQSHIKKWLNIDCGIISDKSRHKRDYTKSIQIASPQALIHLDFELLGDIELVVIDEAHHSHARSYARIFEYFDKAKFLGLTATPARIDGRGLRTLFDGVRGYDELICGINTKSLIDKGYLSPFRLFGNALLDTSKERIKKTGGDFNKKELADFALEADISDALVDAYRKYADGKRAIVYPASVELSKEYCQKFNDKGITAGHIDASTPHKERQIILDAFRDGEILVLCQHSIVIEGVDIPAIEAVLFARPTQSLIIWFQAIGRALRPCEGKEHAILIDLTDNFQRLPLPTDEIIWSLDAVPTINKEHSWQCKECSHLFLPLKKDYERLWGHCPNCGTKYELPKPKQKEQQENFKESFKYKATLDLKEYNIFELLNDTLDFSALATQSHITQDDLKDFDTLLESLLEKKESLNFKNMWVFYRIKDLVVNGVIPLPSQREMRKLALKLGYKQGWAFYKLQEIKDEMKELELLAS